MLRRTPKHRQIHIFLQETLARKYPRIYLMSSLKPPDVGDIYSQGPRGEGHRHIGFGARNAFIRGRAGPVISPGYYFHGKLISGGIQT